MEKKRELFSIIGVLLVLSFISASFEIGDPLYSIEKQYSLGDPIKGWINISLNDEPTNSLFEDSLGNSITLIDLLELNSLLSYSCSPNDCQSDYSESNLETSKTLNIDKRGEEIIGFKIIGSTFQSISSFSMRISSSVPESSLPQLYVDVSNDNKIEWSSYNSSGIFGEEIYGCNEIKNEVVPITNNEFCEIINLPATPNVEIGSSVIADTGGQVSFDFNICDLDKQSCSSCEATISQTGKVSCAVDYGINEEKNFFVCMKTKNPNDNGKYKINAIETPNKLCGYATSEENKWDFEIFAKPGKYAQIGTFTLDKNEIGNFVNSADLDSNISEYLNRYNNDCSSGCIIPIKFTSGEIDQVLTISDVNIEYKITGVDKQINGFYDLTEVPAKISSNFQKIYLSDANFTVSGDFDENITYSLDLDNGQIFTGEILIKDNPEIVSLNTQKAIAIYPTEFNVRIKASNSSKSIVKYEWNFGDASTPKITTENKITHTYASIGSFDLTITITDSEGLKSSRTFNIVVDTPKEAVNSVLRTKLNNLEKINSQIDELSNFHKTSLNSVLGIENIEEKISDLQKRNLTASTDGEYVSIMDNLTKIDVPKSVFETKSVSSIGFYTDKNKIDLDVLEKISEEEEINNENRYLDSIVAWNFENIEAEINVNEFSAIYGDSTEFVLKFFELEINENKAGESSLLIIPKLENLKFERDYQEEEEGGYYYIELNEDNEEISFSTTEEIDFSELEAFISPRIWELSLGSSIPSQEEEEKLSRQTITTLLIMLVIFIGLVAYVLLQEWYKREYESCLFKNKNSLYNIMTYIQRIKKKGAKPGEISSKLRKAGWNSEQTRYVMRKYVGKRTGMFEIPLGKIIKSVNKNKEPKYVRRKPRFRRY